MMVENGGLVANGFCEVPGQEIKEGRFMVTTCVQCRLLFVALLVCETQDGWSYKKQ